MEQITAYYLQNREEVLAKAIEMVEEGATHLYGMGRDLSWLNHPEFRDAVNERTTIREGGDLDMLVIAARQDNTAQVYAREFYEEIQAKVGFSSFGQVRVVLCDGQSLLLGFPVAPDLPDDVSEASLGLYMEHPRLATWLEERFLNEYSTSIKLGEKWYSNFWIWIRNNTYHIIFATLLSVASFVLGVVARVFGM